MALCLSVDPAGMACPSSPALVDLPSGNLTDGLPSNNNQHLIIGQLASIWD